MRHFPHNHPPRPPRRYVHGDGEAHRGDGERHHELQLLAAARLEALAVAPRRELESRGLAYPDQVVPLPPDERHLLGGGRDASLVGGAGEALDALETVVERCQVPAGALGTDDPEAAPPFVERQAPADAEPGGTAVAVQLAVTEGAGAIHQSQVASRKSQGASRRPNRSACGLRLESVNSQRTEIQVRFALRYEIRDDLPR